MAAYDVIVLGTGGVGSAALWQLAQRGARVLGLDRFPPGHDRGSSHGQSRVIRLAYFEHADYVPLLRRAYQLWDELERQSDQQLFHRVGLLEAGPPDGIVVPGVLQSAQQHQLRVETLAADDVHRRFPGFRIPEGYAAVYEADAGYLLVEECVRAAAALAQRQGAELSVGENVVAWQVRDGEVEVMTDRGRYTAARLVVAAGAWAGTALDFLRPRLRVVRKHLHWYATSGNAYSRESGCPTYLFELPGGVYYGFPEIGEPTVKVAEHSGAREPVDDPLSDPRQVDPEDRRRVDAFVAQCLPQATGPVVRHAACFYTLSPDEHFLVDLHPDHPQVAYVAGLSGHGFKFTSVLGEVLAELALQGKTELPIGFLSARRLKDCRERDQNGD